VTKQQTETPEKAVTSQRRSRRLLLRVAVEVTRTAANGNEYIEQSATLAINAHGALIVIKPPVAEGEQFVVKNIKTGEAQPCKAVYLGEAVSDGLQVGIEFLQPSPQMWAIVFPPDDWVNSGRTNQQAKKLENKPS
jgi:hypothetical protein